MGNRSQMSIQLDMPEFPGHDLLDVIERMGTAIYVQPVLVINTFMIKNGLEQFAELFTRLEQWIEYEDFTKVGELKTDEKTEPLWDIYAYKNKIFITDCQKILYFTGYSLDFRFDNLRGKKLSLDTKETFTDLMMDPSTIQLPFFQKYSVDLCK